MNLIDIKKEIKIFLDAIDVKDELAGCTSYFNFDLLEITKKNHLVNYGASPIKSWLHKFNLSGDSVCRCCRMKEETGDHLLFYCERLSINNIY